MKAILLAFTAAFALTAAVHARLGENEAQTAARYGPAEESKPNEEPLMRGAKEACYRTGEWRIRVAFANGIAVRLEYMKSKDAASGQKIETAEVETILEAEKGKYVWHGEVMGKGGRRVQRKEEDATSWERSDHATAQIRKARVIIHSRDAAELEEKLVKLAAARKAATTTPAPKPKF